VNLGALDKEKQTIYFRPAEKSDIGKFLVSAKRYARRSKMGVNPKTI